jgi:peptide/nickel transport system permease protein
MVEAVSPPKKPERRFSPGGEAFRRFRRHRLAAASVVVLALLALA